MDNSLETQVYLNIRNQITSGKNEFGVNERAVLKDLLIDRYTVRVTEDGEEHYDEIASYEDELNQMTNDELAQ